MPKALPMTAEATPAPTHLLLVDDDRLILATLSQGLQDMGYRVSCAESAEEAQDLLTSGLRPDLALLDVRLPGADGLSLAARLCELDHIPFVMLSAYSDEAIVQRAASLGALGYLVKPLDTAGIRPTLEAALQRSREQAQLRQNRDQLQTALHNDRDINVAIGITMVQYRLTRQAAFDMLRAAARSQRRKLAVLAQEVIQASENVLQGSKDSAI
jgi:response regulator NasT